MKEVDFVMGNQVSQLAVTMGHVVRYSYQGVASKMVLFYRHLHFRINRSNMKIRWRSDDITLVTGPKIFHKNQYDFFLCRHTMYAAEFE